MAYSIEAVEAAEYVFPDLTDPFSEWAVPPFPMGCVCKAIRDYALGEAEVSGFDAGGYAFAVLVALASLIDQRARLTVTRSYCQPPMLWGGLVSESGEGKSPVINTGMQFLKRANKELALTSKQAMAQWEADNAGIKKDDKTPQPAWQQLVVNDSTVEALANVLKDNPRGVLLHADELTRWIGQMDAYGGKGADKDRGNYLEMYDGGSKMINRAVKGNTYVENWSMAILGGIQPEKFAAMLNQSKGASSDGLFQRFLIYCLQPSGELNIFAQTKPYAETNVQALANQIFTWSESGLIAESHPYMSDETKHAFQHYANAMRTIQKRTPEARFSEHLGKHPGMAIRLAFALHVIERAVDGAWNPEVGLETFIRAQTIMGCLYRHSEAAYSKLGESVRNDALLQGIAKTILAKGWAMFTNADLMRNCKPWRDSASNIYEKNTALSKLIEMGWLLDVTESDRKHTGRPAQGKFVVNPLVPTRFADMATKVADERAERYEAIKLAGIERRTTKKPEFVDQVVCG